MSEVPPRFEFTVTGPPVPSTMKALFGPYAGCADVTSVVQTRDGIVVAYANGVQLTFAPCHSGGVARSTSGLAGATVLSGCCG